MGFHSISGCSADWMSNVQHSRTIFMIKVRESLHSIVRMRLLGFKIPASENGFENVVPVKSGQGEIA